MSKILLTVNGTTFGVTLQQAQDMFKVLETEIPRLRRERAGTIRDEIKDLQRELEKLGLDGIPPQVSVPASPPGVPPMPDLIGCEAKQYSDEMVCERCNMRWDTNDSYPPACKGIFTRAK